MWYVAYGSNLDRDRFGRYLVGGQAPGATRAHPGCRDGSPPLDDGPWTIAHRLYFARSSTAWGGGVAFVDPEPAPGEMTRCRRYLITTEQFADVWAQECGLTPPAPVAPGTGWYGHLVDLGVDDGVPLRTFTAPAPSAANPPSPAYRATIVRGLQQVYGLAAAAAQAYLDERGGRVSGG